MEKQLPFHEIFNTRNNLNFRISLGDFNDFPIHWQDNIEVVHVISGTANILVDAKSYFLSKGQTLFIGPGEIHRFIKCEKDTKIILFIFRPTIIGCPFPYLEGKKIINPVTSSLEMHTFLWSLINCYNNKRDYWELEAYSIIYSISSFVVNEFEWMTIEKDIVKQRMYRLPMLKKILEYTQNNYNSKITLEEAAKKLSYSIYHFSRIFKQLMGMTYMEYLTDVRMKSAERLLIETEDSVSYISNECGFENIKTFNRLFKQKYSCSPTHFRKSKI